MIEKLNAVGHSRHKDAFTGMDRQDGVHAFDGSNALRTEIGNKGVKVGKVFMQGLGEGDEIGGEIRALGKLHGGVLVIGVVCAPIP